MKEIIANEKWEKKHCVYYVVVEDEVILRNIEAMWGMEFLIDFIIEAKWGSKQEFQVVSQFEFC